MKCYSELILLPTFKERFEYLKFKGPTAIGTPTKFRYLNQRFYSSEEWRDACEKAIARDYGCDLGIRDRPIFGRPRVHHITPLTLEDFENASHNLTNLENLICTSFDTHNAIHYGNSGALLTDYEPRRPNDTCPWKEVAYGH